METELTTKQEDFMIERGMEDLKDKKICEFCDNTEEVFEHDMDDSTEKVLVCDECFGKAQ